MSDVLHAPAALLPGKAPGTHWLWGWIGSRAGLDPVEKYKIPWPFQESNPCSQALTPWLCWLNYIMRIQVNRNQTYSDTGSVVGWGTVLQTGRSPVRFPDEVNFFNLPNPSSRTMALGSTKPLTEMSTRNLSGGKKRPARRADNLAAIYVPIVWQCGSFNLSQP
jgi:hypothetical protein